jgi:hypothetical protein
MNDLSIQGSRAYAVAYASNDAKTQAVAQTTTTTLASGQSSSDKVSISAEALNKFQSETTLTSSVTSTSGGEPEAPGSGGTETVQSGGSTPPPQTPPVVTPFNGEGIRPPV